jgi:hypothetical protein
VIALARLARPTPDLGATAGTEALCDTAPAGLSDVSPVRIRLAELRITGSPVGSTANDLLLTPSLLDRLISVTLEHRRYFLCLPGDD